MVEANGDGQKNDTADSQPSNNKTELLHPMARDPVTHSLSLSQLDSGLSKRPRDARLLHMVLANYGVSAYQERVPLQLMDFTYRYTSSTLQDALHFTAEGYGTTGSGTGTGSGKAAPHHDISGITLSSLRLSIASRTHYQFNPTLPKEFYSEIAQERNRVALPPVSREWGMRLPPEQFCMTGVGWDLKEEFDEEIEDADEGKIRDMEVKDDDMEDDGGNIEDEEAGRMEDLFGNDNDGEMEE